MSRKAEKKYRGSYTMVLRVISLRDESGIKVQVKNEEEAITLYVMSNLGNENSGI